VDGGMIEISTRPGWTLEQARQEMAPPDFTGVTVQQLRERARSWSIGAIKPPLPDDILLANFQVLEDNTIRARLSRQNHLRIIEALWQHRPSNLYPQVKCPVLLMPARRNDDESPVSRRLRREESVAKAIKLLPLSKTIWLEDSIHDVPLQRPQLVADVIREHVKNGFFG
jgi:pimeloyl-ACP methyl ester carboxylesterase